MERAAREEEKAATKSSRRSALIAAGALVATGVALAAAFFPLMFNRWLPRDDEGVFIFGLREFLSNHGHLYSTIWSDLYGPFYYLFMSTVYRVIHQQPTPENARWIVLVLTTSSAAFFGGAVWRATKSLPSSLLCEVGAFMLLIQVAGSEPLHPGSLGVFLLSIVAFEISSYAANRRTVHLVVLGVATGALMMTKVNSGGLVAVALVFALVVGSKRTPRWMQIVIAVLTIVVPIGLISQNIYETWADTFAIIVVGSLIAMFLLMWIDQLPLSRLPFIPIVAGAVGAVVCSMVFPLVTGTPLSDLINGVIVRPLTFSDKFVVPATVTLDWLAFIIAATAIGAAVAFRSYSKEVVRAQATWVHATLAALALWILGLGVMTYAQGYVTARWLPLALALPALALCGGTPESVRLALRSTLVLAILQVLVIYPVAGSQVGWGTVAMVVPCAIALAAGIDHSRTWRESGLLMRGSATAFVCVALIVGTGSFPTTLWKTYTATPTAGLAGTGLMRIDPAVSSGLREVVKQLRANCDTFYGVPNLNSFYIFSGLPAVTGMVANGGIGGLTKDQQQQVIDALAEKTKEGKRVCILRDSGQAVVGSPGPLNDALNRYVRVVATIGSYTIATPI